MEFHLSYHPKPFETGISHEQKIFLIGSCFTEQIGNKLAMHKFRTFENPNGILFNPVSICRSVASYISGRQYTEGDLFYQNECWNSWDHHSRFSDPDKVQCMERINRSQSGAHVFLQQADWLLVTLGSAFVYCLEDGTVVANCHKVPTDKFSKHLLRIDQVTDQLQNLISSVQAFNPGVRIIFTISPVRHLRDGLVENNRSKAALISAVHSVVESADRCVYFPAYELVIDDLRDYRFFAEDMVHPNYAATQYVWEKFVAACIDEPSRQLMRSINEINAARNHKPFNPGSAAHKKFLQSNVEKILLLKKQFGYIDFAEEICYFNS